MKFFAGWMLLVDAPKKSDAPGRCSLQNFYFCCHKGSILTDAAEFVKKRSSLK